MVAVAWYCLIVVMPRSEDLHTKTVAAINDRHRDERKELVEAIAERSRRYEELLSHNQACIDKLEARLSLMEQALRGSGRQQA